MRSKEIIVFTIAILLFATTQLFAQSKITVAQDGTGDYKTIQRSFDAVASNNKKKITIYIKNGIYKEKLHLDSGKAFVTLIGEDKFNTILNYNDHTGKISPGGDTINTRTSASLLIKANDFTAENITFQNDAGFNAGQAVAIEVDGDRAAFRNCRFIGNQDVLFTNNDNSRQYYNNCYIEGTTDFIFGSSTVWFERCHIHSKKNSHITAASTPQQNAYGYVFNDCILTGDSSLDNASLGRPWRHHASVTYLHCYIDRHIKAEGWSVWNKNDNHTTSRYAEYGSYGPGGNSSYRVPWAKKLMKAEAKSITVKKVLKNWEPFR